MGFNSVSLEISKAIREWNSLEKETETGDREGWNRTLLAWMLDNLTDGGVFSVNAIEWSTG